MKKKKKRSVWPIYAIAVVWILCTLVYGLSSPLDYVRAILASGAIYLVMRAIFPTQVVEVQAPPKEAPKAQPAEDPELAALKRQRDLAISEMRRLNDNIQDPTISRQIDHLEHTTGKIFAVVLEKPEKKSQIRQFLDYYLPTTIKLLNAYDRADSTGISGSNVNATKEKVREMLTQIEGAFDRQLDSLFQAEALDISTDIQVMETLLAQEGLSDGKGRLQAEK